MRPASFFDEEGAGKQKSIWSPPSSQNNDLSKIQPYLSTTFYKKAKGEGKCKKIAIYLDHSYMYCAKNEKSTAIDGILDLTCVKVDFVTVSDPKAINSECTSQLFGFKLSRNQRGIDLYTTDEILFKDWKKIFSYRAI